MLKRKGVNAAAMLADMAAQIKEGHVVTVAEFAKEHAAAYADNSELIAGMVTLLADAIIDPPKVEGRRRNMPKHGTLRVSVNDSESVAVNPYVSAKTTMRNFNISLKERAALSDYNFLTAARELVAGSDVLPYFDSVQRELTGKTARAALVASRLSSTDGRSFKRLARDYVCKKHGVSQERLTELTR